MLASSINCELCLTLSSWKNYNVMLQWSLKFIENILSHAFIVCLIFQFFVWHLKYSFHRLRALCLMFLLRNKYCANVTIIIYWDLRVSPVSRPYILDRSQVYLFACQLPTKYHTRWLTRLVINSWNAITRQ